MCPTGPPGPSFYTIPSGASPHWPKRSLRCLSGVADAPEPLWRRRERLVLRSALRRRRKRPPCHSEVADAPEPPPKSPTRQSRTGPLPVDCRSGRSSAQLPSPAGDQSLVVVGAAAARDPRKPRGIRETVPPPDQRQQPPLDFGDCGGDPVQQLTRLEFRQGLRRLRFGRLVERTPFSSIPTKTLSPVPKDEIPGNRGEPWHGDDGHRRPLSQQPQPDVLGDVVRLGLSKARVDATREDAGIGFRDPRLRFATGSEADLPPRIARGRPPHHSLRPREVLAGFFLSPAARSIRKSGDAMT